jgi:hypothetical protein
MTDTQTVTVRHIQPRPPKTPSELKAHLEALQADSWTPKLPAWRTDMEKVPFQTRDAHLEMVEVMLSHTQASK